MSVVGGMCWWDGGGRTQDVRSELEVVSVCRELFDGGKHDAAAARHPVSIHSVISNALLTRY